VTGVVTTRYALLFGFGLFDPANLKYNGYVDRFARFIKKNKIDVALICGGHTDVSAPEKSEAGTIAEYLRQYVASNVRIELEERSLTAEQNVSFAKEHINLAPENKIYVIADSVRFFKTFWIVLDRWFGLSRVEITDIFFEIINTVQTNPKKKETTILLKELKPLLKYKNVKIVVDAFHRDYRNAMHTIISEVFEIDSLHDQGVYDKYLKMTRIKFRME
jgi:hypothetical protein